MDSASVRRLPGTESATAAIWSPDSQSIAFLGDWTLRRIALGGGPPIAIAKVPDADLFDGGAWSERGVILLGCRCGLDRVDVATGEVKRLRAIDKAAKETGFGSPQFLPGGERFLYQVVSDDPARQGTYVSSLARPEERTQLLKIAGKAVYAPSTRGHPGYLLWTADQTLMARPFDADSLTFEGEAVAIAENISFSDLSTQQYSWERAAFWVSTNGLLVYSPAVEPPHAKLPLAWVDRNGKVLGDLGPEGPYNALAVSPDGRRAALTRQGIRRTAEPSSDIWLWDAATDAISKATFNPATDENPVWSPDGQQIAFSSNRERLYQVYRKNVSGAGDEERITNVPRNTDPLAWSPDGRYLVYRQLNPGTGWDLMLVALAGDRKPVVLLQSPESDSDARFSPDGRYLAFHSRMNGSALEVFVQAFRGDGQPGLVGERLQISNNTGSGPVWSRSGREIFYFQPSDGKQMSATVHLSPTLRVERPRELFPSPMSVGGLHTYDVSADDQRFLMVLKRRRAPDPLHLNVVTNWHRLLSH
jgi:dipeptidyl aminopeptidase/acylaminoacyl peptidase